MSCALIKLTQDNPETAQLILGGDYNLLIGLGDGRAARITLVAPLVVTVCLVASLLIKCCSASGCETGAHAAKSQQQAHAGS